MTSSLSSTSNSTPDFFLFNTQLSAEELYWQNGKGKRTGCRPNSTIILGHYHTLRKAKINSIMAYLYYKWNRFESEKEKYKVKAIGQNLNGINLYIKEYMNNWGFAKNSFGENEFGSYHQPLHFYGFSTVAFGIAAFGTPSPPSPEEWDLVYRPLVK